jgi:hypothetical protein
MAEPLEFVGTGPIPPGLHLETREELATKLTIAESANVSLMRQLKEERNRADGLAETVSRLKGALGYLAEGDSMTFVNAMIRYGNESCVVDIEPDCIRVRPT